MKIIVATQAEKDLVNRFLTAMRELDGIDQIIDLDAKTADDNDLYFEPDDRDFLYDAMNARVETGDVYPLCVEDSNIIGTCVVCGTQTHGTFDGNDVSYDDYLDMMSPECLKTWKCESCTEKGE